MIETVAKRNCSGCRWNIYRNSFDPATQKWWCNMLHLDYFEELMTKLVAIRQTINFNFIIIH
jgi:2-dehydro-3-deoxyphosphooctonate aldolase (KDO 8-P synthase)